MLNSLEEGTKLFIKENNTKLVSDYNSIAIIGCQSSGKSTLLNKVFDTAFKEMNSDEANIQTTQGIWVSVNPEFKTIIIDCEGTDSKERGENRLQFENCSSLFCLALSDVLLVNMWTQDVGRYTASNYNVLKIVFEMNLRLFQQQCSKRIVVVLRDYNDKLNKKEKFEKLILNDIAKLWEDIKKPDKFINSKPEDFFEFEFITLPHKIYMPKEFDAEINLFKNRFNISNQENYLFKHSLGSKGVPIDGYIKFCQNVWDTIINEKDLNIPSQKEMLAIYRCNEIKEESYQKIALQLHELNQKTSQKILPKFKEIVKKLYQDCMSNYDSLAKNYLEKIFVDVQQTLKKQIINETFVSFTNQINRILPTSLKNFAKELENELSKGNKFIFL